MTLEAAEVWAPGARADIRLVPLTAPEALRDRVAIAVGATGSVDARIEHDADGILRIRLIAERAETIRFVARFTVVDAVSLWRPGSGEERGTLPPSWVAPRTTRALADVPIGCLIGRHDTSLVGFGVAAGLTARPGARRHDRRVG